MTTSSFLPLEIKHLIVDHYVLDTIKDAAHRPFSDDFWIRFRSAKDDFGAVLTIFPEYRVDILLLIVTAGDAADDARATYLTSMRKKFGHNSWIPAWGPDNLAIGNQLRLQPDILDFLAVFVVKGEENEHCNCCLNEDCGYCSIEESGRCSNKDYGCVADQA